MQAIRDCFNIISESLQVPGFSNAIKVVRLQHGRGAGNNMGIYRLLEVRR